jgi:hypothetical protein
VSTRGRLAAAWHSGPLVVPSFRLLAGGQFASTIGDYCYAVALPWLVLSTHGNAILLGTVLACYGVPRTVLIPVGGVLTDKIGPRTLMLVADTIRCVLVAGLAVLAARHDASLAALGPAAALIGAGEGLFIPASFAIMPSLLKPGQLAAGNALSTAAVQAGSLLGPALGGALVAATRASTAAFAVDAVSFAVSALSLALIPRRRVAETEGATTAPGSAETDRTDRGEPPAGSPDAAGQGDGVLALLRRSRALQVILVAVVVANLAGGGTFEVALPALAHARFGAGGYGALLACVAAGGLIGTLAAARTGGLRTPAVFASAAFIVYSAVSSLVPYLGGVAGAAAALFVAGACNGLGNVTILTVTQKWTPPALLGRVMSAIMLCAFGSFPLSVVVGGVLVRHLGSAVFFPISGGLVFVAIAGGMTQREFRRFGAAADPEAAQDPNAAQDPKAAEGSRK